jgi:hypothetical protein
MNITELYSNEILFSGEDFAEFREWLSLNMEGITWQGKYKDEFEDFWSHFFVSGMSLTQMMKRFEYAIEKVKIGPLTSWFSWLQEKFLCYIFVSKEISIDELSGLSRIRAKHLANILRNFFTDNFPHLDDHFSEVFQIAHHASENLSLSFKKLDEDLNLSNNKFGSFEDDIMPSMEVTLYEEWGDFLTIMKKDFVSPEIDLNKIKKEASLRYQLHTIRDFIFFLAVGVVFIFVIKIGNEYYNNTLKKKISIYEPQFQWLDKTLTFKTATTDVVSESFKLDVDEIENIVDSKFNIPKEFQEAERFETESEVILTSWDSLPKNFTVTELEQSKYEEIKKGGYRNTRFGNKKVYRVMMKSVDTFLSRKKLVNLLTKYAVKQADQVEPGLIVPGGVYYNLFVPRKFLKEFLAQVMDIDESILYESRTRGRNPVGKNKVFIWMKSI